MNFQHNLFTTLCGKRMAGGLAGLTLGVISVTAQAVTVTDIAGRTVTVPDDVQRVVSTALSAGREISVSLIRKPTRPIRRNSRKSTKSR